VTPRTPKLRSLSPEASEPRPDPTDQIRLTADRILIQVPDESERRSKTGLVIPATAAHPIKRCVWSQVVLVGPEVRNVKAGDQILFIPQTGLEVDWRGDTYMLLRERDVQAIASDRTDPHGGGQYL
jgi:chaperonin GroES